MRIHRKFKAYRRCCHLTALASITNCDQYDRKFTLKKVVLASPKQDVVTNKFITIYLMDTKKAFLTIYNLYDLFSYKTNQQCSYIVCPN